VSADYVIRHVGGGKYVAYDRAGRAVSAISATAALAERSAELRARALASRRRACLCCGGPFASEGAHHRLCATCSRLGGAASPYEDPHAILSGGR